MKTCTLKVNNLHTVWLHILFVDVMLDNEKCFVNIDLHVSQILIFILADHPHTVLNARPCPYASHAALVLSGNTDRLRPNRTFSFIFSANNSSRYMTYILDQTTLG